MDDNLNYETYLLISSKKLIISVNTDYNKKIYLKELILDDESNRVNFDILDHFLNENIFKIEKKIKNFIKKTSVILDIDTFFPLEISIQKKNYDSNINLGSLSHILYEAKDYCKKTIDKKKIIHMLIDNYIVDNKNHSFLPEGVKCNNFSMDIKFLCISNHLIKNLEKILKKYQISLNRLVSATYINKFLPKEEKDIFLMAKKIINGHNPNEVFLIDKTQKNRGFFEKFFNFFN